jgi:thiopurine S-methyltransferase
MDSNFWLQRWREGRTGWHHDSVMPWLQKHWPSLGLESGTRVMVPLCGKSLDMPWLAAQGHQVLGIELAQQAIEAFFADNGLQPDIATDHAGHAHYTAGSIEIIHANVFDVAQATLASCAALYDRAALIALPAAMRHRYAAHVYGSLGVGARALLITLDYPQDEMAGPPFSVDTAEVRRLFADRWSIERLERRDVLDAQPSFVAAGVTSLHTCVYRLRCGDDTA